MLLLAPLAWADNANPNRGYLGVQLHTTEFVHKDGVPVEQSVGVFVSNVLSGGPAELAGLRADDRVVAVDGQPIRGMVDLKKAMIDTQEGDRLSVTVERDDRERTFDVVLGELPKKHSKVERFGVMVEEIENRAFVGIESQPVEDQLAEYFGVEGGILVTRVVEGSAAEKAGIEAGDVIVAWEDTQLRQAHDVREMISRSKPGDQVALSVSRRGVESLTYVTLDAASDHIELRKIESGRLRHLKEKLEYKVKIKETKDSGR
jgi:serine protease Do